MRPRLACETDGHLFELRTQVYLFTLYTVTIPCYFGVMFFQVIYRTYFIMTYTNIQTIAHKADFESGYRDLNTRPNSNVARK